MITIFFWDISDVVCIQVPFVNEFTSAAGKHSGSFFKLNHETSRQVYNKSVIMVYCYIQNLLVTWLKIIVAPNGLVAELFNGPWHRIRNTYLYKKLIFLLLKDNLFFTLWIPVRINGFTNVMYKIIFKGSSSLAWNYSCCVCVVLWLGLTFIATQWAINVVNSRYNV